MAPEAAKRPVGTEERKASLPVVIEPSRRAERVLGVAALACTAVPAVGELFSMRVLVAGLAAGSGHDIERHPGAAQDLGGGKGR
jgi:hypothetical protein